MLARWDSDECTLSAEFIIITQGILFLTMSALSTSKAIGKTGCCICAHARVKRAGCVTDLAHTGASVHRLIDIYYTHNDTQKHTLTLVSQEAVVNYITVLFWSSKSSREAKANAFMFDFWLQHSQRENCFHHALSPPLLSQ